MWIINELGMYSAVEHSDDPALVVVRSRVIADAERLAAWANAYEGCEDHEIIETELTDYPVRVIMTKSAWGGFLYDSAMSIDYGNFKAHIDKIQGRERELIYSSVWSVLLRLERFNPRVRRGSYADTFLSYSYSAGLANAGKKKKKTKKKSKA